MNKIISILPVILLVLSSCNDSHDKNHDSHDKEHEEILKLGVTTPYIKDTLVIKDYVCQIHASNRIELRAIEKGYLQKIFVDEGQTVTKGQPMFKIMPNVYSADLKKMKAEADVAQIEYKNTKLLADKKIVSQNELALVNAKLEKAKAEVGLAQTHLGFTNVNAPFNGIMDLLHVRVGSLLDEGELLTTLTDVSKMWVYFNVPEEEYLDYISNTDNENKKQVQLKLANDKLFSEIGIIETIEGEFNNETGNIEFRATFPNPDKILRHGQTGSILIKEPYENAMLIPQISTFEILDKTFVFVVNEENKIEQKQIIIAEELPHLFIVKEGLKRTDRILLEGLRKVSNGQEIEMNLQDPEKVLSDLEIHAE